MDGPGDLTGGDGGDGDIPDDGTGGGGGGTATANAVNDSNAAWEYAKLSVNKVLGFDVGQGPYVIEADTLTPAPGFFDLSQRQYLWLRLKVNDTFIGDCYEFSTEGIFQGPYFSKLLLINNGMEHLTYSAFNSGKYVFNDLVTVSKLTFELIDPLLGTVIERHDSQGKEWNMEFILNGIHS